jgi:hypothetical protein
VDADRREFVRERRSRDFNEYPSRAGRNGGAIEWEQPRSSFGGSTKGSGSLAGLPPPPRPLIEYRVPPEERVYEKRTTYIKREA